VTDILLVHGAWDGPWCWDGFAARLGGHGHQVQAVRLRGHRAGTIGEAGHQVQADCDDMVSSRPVGVAAGGGHQLGQGAANRSTWWAGRPERSS
jgi:hypothetical protein